MSEPWVSITVPGYHLGTLLKFRMYTGSSGEKIGHDDRMPSSAYPVCSEHKLQHLAEGGSAEIAAVNPLAAQQEMFQW